ncbi:DUF4489 domain-containing protein [Hazenella sp. IB182357]|uniref:DUF4489 domain-containing protein n=1 Tax=Polycladospora coralii TaxID=2771432 RepID=A0A926RUC7_9BACL|nr:DUF4489 domain-containing protein [Polycladospora coralii]MBD1373785.1 DUF4489 domain-containing protein [Polycladospora coralii]MBS7531563.1 DUF4489 domain-containing protein [Polycladospora coralii]
MYTNIKKKINTAGHRRLRSIKKKSLLVSNLICGKITNPSFSVPSSSSALPIQLARLCVGTKKLINPVINISYTNFTLVELNGILQRVSLTYTLTRESKENGEIVTLKQWQSLNSIAEGRLSCNIPLAVQFCDEVKNYNANKLIYKINVASVQMTAGSNLKISSKDYTALVSESKAI